MPVFSSLKKPLKSEESTYPLRRGAFHRKREASWASMKTHRAGALLLERRRRHRALRLQSEQA